MTSVTNRQRTIIRAAKSFALWRAPDDTAPTLFASTRRPTVGPVFARGEGHPFFAMAPFETDDGNEAWHIPADIIDGPEDFYVAQGQGALLDSDPGPFHAPASTVALPEPVGVAQYEDRISRVIGHINEGKATKVVMSRVEPKTMHDPDLIARFDALAAAYPTAFVVLASSEATGTWLVATPETLLHVDDQEVRTMALAGTQWPEEPTDLASVSWSEKLTTEQGIVAEEIRRIFTEVGIDGLKETPARTVRAANLCHLRSDFTAPRPDDAVLADLLRRMHPTSAVSGMPRAAAQKLIAREEGASRGFYTGYLGPCRYGGETRLFVNLRSAQIVNDTAYLYMGGGIVAESEPTLEWQETLEKAKTIGRFL